MDTKWIDKHKKSVISVLGSEANEYRDHEEDEEADKLDAILKRF